MYNFDFRDFDDDGDGDGNSNRTRSGRIVAGSIKGRRRKDKTDAPVILSRKQAVAKRDINGYITEPSFVCERCNEAFKLDYLVIHSKGPYSADVNLCKDCARYVKANQGQLNITGRKGERKMTAHTTTPIIPVPTPTPTPIPAMEVKAESNIPLDAEALTATIDELVQTYGDQMTIRDIRSATGLSDIYIRKRIRDGKWGRDTDDQGRVVVPTGEVGMYIHTRAARHTKSSDGKRKHGSDVHNNDKHKRHEQLKLEIDL